MVINMSSIPNGWKSIPLNQECTFERGVEPKSSQINSDGNGKPFLKVSSLSGKRNELFFTTLETNKWANKGDILISLDGSLGIVRRDIEGIFSSGIRKTSFKDTKKYSNNYLYYGLQSDYIQKTIVKHCNDGGIIKHASNSIKFMNLLIPEEIVEQEKIASILSKVDEQIQVTEAIIDKTEQLKKGLMQELLTKGIGHTEFKETELGTIPKEWEIKKLNQLCIILYGKNQKDVLLKESSIPILGTGGIIGFASKPLFSKPSLLIGRKGTIDKPQYIDRPFWTVDTLFYTDVNEDVFVKWLYYSICNKDLKKLNEATGVPSLNRTALYLLKIATPSFAEQNKIASILSSVDNQIQDNKIELQRLNIVKKGLMQDLLTGKVRVVI